MSQVKYQLDPAHSAARFSIRHMMISNVRGHFAKLSGVILYDAENPENSSVEASIDASSITTGDTQRDGHLKSADFLDVEHFPALTFRSKSISTSNDGGKVKGDLTIHGVSREVVLDVEDLAPEAKDPWGNFRIGGIAKTKINRKDFGLSWNSALETGGVLVGDEAKIEIDFEGIRQN